MQYLYRNMHDPIIRCRIDFDGRIDEGVIKQAVTASFSFIPILECRFDPRHVCWIKADITAEDIVETVIDEDGKAAQKLLTSSVDIFKGPQLRLFLIREPQNNTLCAVINHMVCDGAGFKEYIYLLCGLYTDIQDGRSPRAPLHAPRGAGQLFASFGLRDTLHILTLKYDLSVQKEQTGYPLQGDRGNPFIVTRLIPADAVVALRSYSRKRGTTFNDLLLTAHIRVASRRTGNERIVMPCPVDLRKYLRKETIHGITNLTSNYICDVKVKPDDTFEDTLESVHSQMTAQKESHAALKSVIMLAASFHLIPFGIVKRHFHQIFTVPVLSYTNLGVIDKDRLRFGNVSVKNAIFTGAIKYVPYFQLAVSTFDGTLTLSSNLYGTPEDRAKVESYLADVAKELNV